MNNELNYIKAIREFTAVLNYETAIKNFIKGLKFNPNHVESGPNGGQFTSDENVDPPLTDPSKPRHDLVNQMGEIENQITKRGLEFSFIGHSQTNGNSIYYHIIKPGDDVLNSPKSRFSDHGISNPVRIENELLFDLPFQGKFSRSGVKHIYYNNDANFKKYFDK